MTTTTTQTPTTSRSGRIVTATETSGHLDDLDRDRVTAALRTDGAILFRGLAGDLTTFSDLVQRVSSRVTLDPARSFHGTGVAQKVDAGTAAMGMHLENGATPFMPDVVWFFCDRAARSGSETTICDGASAVTDLRDDVRAAFTEKRITYSRNVSEDRWRVLASRLHPGARTPEEVTFDDLVSTVNDPAECSFELNPDGSISYRFSTHAVHGDQFTDSAAFAHSIFGPSYNYDPPLITFEDGSAIPPEYLADARVALDASTKDIVWQSGDLAVIDNTRVMHGRREVLDPQRRIFNALSYL